MDNPVTSRDIAEAIRTLGVTAGNTLLVHSSLRSLGPLEGGAQAVIDGLESVLGREGTLVMPTLSQVDFNNSYKTWYMDKPSDVGYLTEYFRKQPYVYRSNQETHSVAARGRLAYELTYEHKGWGPHLCPYGEYAFADSSPWQKMYRMNARVLMLGVNLRAFTLKHPIEARLMEHYSGMIRDPERREELLRDRMTPESHPKGFWLFLDAARMQAELERLGLIRQTICGNAVFLLLEAKTACDAIYELVVSEPECWFTGERLKWIRTCLAASE